MITLEMKKKNDGTAILTFVRADGSRTSSPIGPAHGYFPAHDLTHYAVESILRFSRGFIGLCAEGWAIGDFEKDAPHRLPPEAGLAEVVAGEVSRMEMMGQWGTLEEFNWAIAEGARGWKSGDRVKNYGEMGAAIERWRAGETPIEVTSEQYESIRRALTNLRAKWYEVPAGGTLSLSFEPGKRMRVGDDGELLHDE